MPQTQFNFHDSLLHVRLWGLLAIATVIVCLGIIEFRRPRGRLSWLGLGAFMLVGLAVTAKVLAQLRGA